MKHNGDCFEIAGNMIIDIEDDNVMLCHGVVIGQGPIEGIRYVHAWIEKDGYVRDKANGNNLYMSIKKYYRIGQINEYMVRKYTKPEAIKLLLKTKHYGPWDNELSKIIKEAIKEYDRRNEK